MNDTNFGVIVIVGIVALALVVFLALRNRRDKKEILPPESTGDAVNTDHNNQQRNKDQI